MNSLVMAAACDNLRTLGTAEVVLLFLYSPPKCLRPKVVAKLLNFPIDDIIPVRQSLAEFIEKV